MGLVAFLQPAQDRDGVLHRRLSDHHRLEAPFQGGVLLDVLAVLVQGGRADQVQLAAGQHRFEHVGGVHRALGCPRAHHRVQLVDEDDHIVGLGDLFEHGFQALLELAAVLGAGHHRAQIDLDQAFVLECFGHVPTHDALRQAFRDSGLAHARLADQHRVVLGAPRKDLDHAADLLVPADDRVELAPVGQLGQVPAVFLQGGVRSLGILAGHALRTAHLGQGLQHRIAGHAGLAQDLRGHPAGRMDQGQQQMFRADVLIAELLDLVVGAHQHLAQALRHPHLYPTAAYLWQALQFRLYFL